MDIVLVSVNGSLTGRLADNLLNRIIKIRSRKLSLEFAEHNKDLSLTVTPYNNILSIPVKIMQIINHSINC
jgi:hypothetical protein